MDDLPLRSHNRLPGLGARARVAIRAAQLEERVVWILGSPRSGTTWLVNLLAAVTGASKINEPLIGAHLGVPTGAVSGLPGLPDSLVYDDHAQRDPYFFSDSSRHVWRPKLRSLILHRFAAQAIRAGRRSSDLVLVKEPNGSIAAPLLVDALPRSRLLFLVRDGRDVVDSLLDGVNGGWITENFGFEVGASGRRRYMELRAHQWVQTVGSVQRAYRSLPPAQRHLVTYEALRADTEVEVGRIIEWLGRREALERVPDVVNALSFENVPAESKGAGRFVRAASPGLWRERFDSDERAALAEIMGPMLADLGYT